MKGRVYLGLFAIALLWGGGQGVHTAATNLKPAAYDFDTYLNDRPQDKWLTLNDTQLDLTQAAYSQTRLVGTINEAYVPVFSTTDENRDFIDVVIQTKDKGIIQTIQSMEEVLSQDEKAIIEYLAKNRDNIFLKKDISGVVKFGIEVDDDTRRELNDIYGNTLAEKFVFIEDDAKPNFLLSGTLFTVGLITGGLTIKPLVLRKKQAYPNVRRKAN